MLALPALFLPEWTGWIWLWLKPERLVGWPWSRPRWSRGRRASFFAELNYGVTADARAKVVVEDGRTYLAASPDRSDVVVSDLFLPWAPGEGRLYSVEHFRDVKRALQPGGVSCQWLAMYQLTPGQFDTIARTFQSVFPKTFLFGNGAGSGTPALALVGTVDDHELDWAQIGRTADAADLEEPLLRGRGAIRELYLGSWESDGPGPINTPGNLAVELDAGIQRLTGDPTARYLDGRRWLDFELERRQKTDRVSEISLVVLRIEYHFKGSDNGFS